MNTNAQNKPLQGLELLAQSIETSVSSSKINPFLKLSGSREGLHKKVLAYYDILSRKFPNKINWDGNEFEYTEWELASYVLNFNVRTGELGFTDVLLNKSLREELPELLRGISEGTPADILFPLEDLGIVVPLLDIKKIYYIGFASNLGL